MKMPENIRRGMQCCLPRDEERCYSCPYFGEGCYDARIAETIEYITQLEAERDALLKVVHECGAACDLCANGDDIGTKCEPADYLCKECEENCLCKTCENGSNWQWKGISEGGG